MSHAGVSRYNGPRHVMVRRALWNILGIASAVLLLAAVVTRAALGEWGYSVAYLGSVSGAGADDGADAADLAAVSRWCGRMDWSKQGVSLTNGTSHFLGAQAGEARNAGRSSWSRARFRTGDPPRPLLPWEQAGVFFWDYTVRQGAEIERGWTLLLPWWLVFVTAGLAPMKLLVGALRDSRRARFGFYDEAGVGLCRSCGCDVRAGPERCPDCGTLVTVAEPPALARDRTPAYNRPA